VKRYFVRIGGGQPGRFWEIARSGDQLQIRDGLIGMSGETTTLPAGEGDATIAKLVAEKEADGYFEQEVLQKEIDAAPSWQEQAAEQAARNAAAVRERAMRDTGAVVKVNAALEKRILAAPDDDAARTVYADWLEGEGDVRGNVAALQPRKQTPKLQRQAAKLLGEHPAHFFGPLAPWVVTGSSDERLPVVARWLHGWIDALELSAQDSDHDGMPAEDVADLVRVVPEVRSARFLRELVLVRGSSDGDFAPAVAALARVIPKLPLLRTLTIGAFTDEESEISWTRLGKLDKLWRVAWSLEELRLRAGEMTLGTIDAPALRVFRIETGGLDRKALAAIVKAPWRKLERLDVWFGSPAYGGNCTVDDVAKLLAKSFPKLSHLGLANSTFGDELVERLVESKLLKQLSSLDLSMSHLTIDGARIMASHAKRFAHLDRLDLSRCLLSAAAKKLVAKIARSVDVREQAGSPGADSRYCAVGE
jgi:uncharacterized protein (TIGR02996 family)